MALYTNNMTRDKVAELAHDIWVEWMQYMLSKVDLVSKSDTNGVEYILRWKRQMKTKFKGLPEAEKASDYEIADRYIKAIQPSVE